MQSGCFMKAKRLVKSESCIGGRQTLIIGSGYKETSESVPWAAELN